MIESVPADQPQNAQNSQNEDPLFVASSNSSQAIHAFRQLWLLTV